MPTYLASYSQSLDKVTFIDYIWVMKARNIIAADGTQSESFAVARHIILRNFWEYYLEEPDENGITFGFVMGNENEWGSVDYNEIKPYIISEAKGTALDEVMPPAGYVWEDEDDE